MTSSSTPGNLPGGFPAASYIEGAGPGPPVYADSAGTVGGSGGTQLNQAAVNAALTAAAVNALLVGADVATALNTALATLRATGTATAARATRTASLTLTATTWTKIPIDTLTFDKSGGSMDVTTNHRYDVPAAGTYQVDAAVELALASGQTSVSVGIYQNGALVSSLANVIDLSTASSPSVLFSDLVSCAAGDYLELWAWCSAADAIVNSVPFLSIIKVDN